MPNALQTNEKQRVIEIMIRASPGFIVNQNKIFDRNLPTVNYDYPNLKIEYK